MAILHKATLHPTKLELLAAWLPGRGWYAEPDGELTRVASYRFDDPAGVVGIETSLVRVGDGPVYQVPLTYREAPLEGGDGWLLGTAEHSVLGKRWIYDGCGDPVYVTALAGAVFGAVGQAEEFFDGGTDRREPSMRIAATPGEAPSVTTIRHVVGDDPTLIVTDDVELTLARRLGAAALTGALLTATWPGQETPVALASASQ
ncbi:CG0192-related protein [Actinophytocola oryzae]|uniref:Maltokinase N-terminal cap domain-containing protein n=1 Tax=Actinophytocola oryzae TaxID=502181 RepID=A0A4R7W4B5_9PSEU|nr:hypothetical protein [Actinophytocola oryzae]TDV57550.1 hypothetical protein CLV71_101421 [Actinophytocola oryzae]